MLAHPYATVMFYAWSQGGGRVDVMQRVAARGSNETWLLGFIQAFSGPGSTLSFDALASFFESPVAVTRRIRALADQNNQVAKSIIRSILANNHASEDALDAILAEWELREAGPQVASNQNTDEAIRAASIYPRQVEVIPMSTLLLVGRLRRQSCPR